MNVERKRQKLTEDASCPRCGKDNETLEHLFRSCAFSRSCWGPRDFNWMQSKLFFTWLRENNMKRNWLSNSTVWGTKFVFMLWGIWRERNELIFNAAMKELDDVVRWAMHQAKEVVSWATPHAGVGSCKSQWISWSPPGEGWIKLNMDGAMRASTGLASAEG